MSNAVQNSLYAEVTLWTHAGKRLDLSPGLISFQTSKAIGAPTGQWSLVFRADDVRDLGDALEEIQDDDWLAIVATDRLRAHKDRILMWGPVDAVWQSEVPEQQNAGVITREVTLNGRDFAKMPTQHQLLFNMYLQRAVARIPGLIKLEQHRALQDLAVTAPQMQPQEVALELLRILVVGEADTSLWVLPPAFGDRHLGDMLQYEQHVIEGQITQVDTYVPHAPQALDQYLRNIFQTPFVEFFWDLRSPTPDLEPTVIHIGADDGRPGPGSWLRKYEQWPTLVIRPTPFTGAVMFDGTPSEADLELTQHKIDPMELGVVRLGKSGAERRTMFAARTASWRADSSAGTWGQSGGHVPLFVVNNELATLIERHGIRILEVTDPHAPVSNMNDGPPAPPIEWVKRRTEYLYGTQAPIPDLLQGVINLERIRPEIRIGESLRLRNRTFYVEGVAHQGDVHPDSGVLIGRTSLTVNRGQKLRDIERVNGIEIATTRQPEVPGPWKMR